MSTKPQKPDPKPSAASRQFKGAVNVGIYRVAFRYYLDFGADLTPHLQWRLTEDAARQAACGIDAGFRAGALYVYGQKSVTCLRCGKTRYHPSDVRHRYCRRCGDDDSAAILHGAWEIDYSTPARPENGPQGLRQPHGGPAPLPRAGGPVMRSHDPQKPDPQPLPAWARAPKSLPLPEWAQPPKHWPEIARHYYEFAVLIVLGAFGVPLLGYVVMLLHDLLSGG